MARRIITDHFNIGLDSPWFPGIPEDGDKIFGAVLSFWSWAFGVYLCVIWPEEYERSSYFIVGLGPVMLIVSWYPDGTSKKRDREKRMLLGHMSAPEVSDG